MTGVTPAEAVLFDLDGTLIDTAPDMVVVLQDMLRDHGIDEVDYDTGRSFVSNGSRGLIGLGFGQLEDERRMSLQSEYLERYSKQLSRHSSVFEGLDATLERLDEGAIPWGVVTNKPAFLTDPLMRDLGLAERSAVTVSGDTLSERKPHPAPLLHACSVANLNPARTLYVGDAQRDIDAGKRALMPTIAAAYGYVVADDNPEAWDADMIVHSVEELSQLLEKAFSL